MSIKLSEKDMQAIYALVNRVNKLIIRDIDGTFISALNTLTPLRHSKKVVGYTYSSRYDSFRLIVVNRTMLLKSWYNHRSVPINNADVKMILPFSDEIVDAVTTRKDEVRRLLHLRKAYTDIPNTIAANDIVDVGRFKYIDENNRTVKLDVSHIEFSVANVLNTLVMLDTTSDVGKFFTFNLYASNGLLFVRENYDVLMETLNKIPDWYSKTYRKQLKIRDAMLSIEKTVKLERKLLE